MSRLRHSRWAETFRRCLATGCAALVFALGVFAVSPALHARLHQHAPASSDDDGCAVVLFASGITATLAMTAPPPPAARWIEPCFAGVTEIFLESPAYLWQPERGPPLV